MWFSVIEKKGLPSGVTNHQRPLRCARVKNVSSDSARKENAGAIAGELRRGIEGRHVERKKIADGVEIFATIETAENHAAPVAGERFAGLGEGTGHLLEKDLPLLRRGLRRLFRRHVPEVDLLEDVVDSDEGVEIGGGKRQLVETSIALLFLGAVAVVAVGGEEAVDLGRIGVQGKWQDEKES